MKKAFGGPAIVLDRSDINTDEIIPAKYLTEVTKEALKPYCLEDLKLEGFDPDGDKLNQSMSNHLSLKHNLIILCGHYKGVDQRVRDLFITKGFGFSVEK